MESDGGATGNANADKLPIGLEPGPARLLLVGDAAWIDHAASAFDDGEVTVDVEPDPTVARELLVGERFDCVAFGGDSPDETELTLLEAVRTADSKAATVLVTDVDAATRLTAEAASITEVVPSGDGIAWRLSLVGLLRQLATRVRSERDTSARIGFYEAVMESMGDFVVVFDAEGEVRYVSPSIERVTGMEPRAVFEAGPFGLVHPDEVPEVAEAFWEMLTSPAGTSAKIETKAHHADGTWRNHEAVATNRLADPRVEGVVVNVRDVTDPARSKAHPNEDLERITDGFFALDAEWRFTYVNETAAELLGESPEELVGTDIWSVFPDATDLAFYEEYRAALESGDPVAFEERYTTGEWFEVRAYPSETGVSVYFRDVTDQREPERKFRTVFERAIDAIVIADDEGRYVDVNPAASELFGLAPEELIGRPIAEFASDEFDFEGVWEAFTETTHKRGTFALVRPDGEERIVEFSASMNVLPDWHLSVMRDVTEQQGYERTLRALHESTRELLGAETERAIAEHLVETAVKVLDFPGVVVYLFDESENVLRPAAASSDGTDVLGEPPVLGGDSSSITWTTFVEGEPAIFDDVRTSEHVHDPGTAFRAGLYVPLGDYGVVVVGSTATGAFDERTADLADLLAATGEAALDRVSRERTLRERDTKLQSQNRQLRRLNRVNEIIREIDHALVQAETREEIERTVCARLAETDRFAFAWIGEREPETDQLRPRSWEGNERGYLDAVAFTVDSDEPTARARLLGDTVVVENVAAELRTESWRKEALSRNYQSVLSVPLIHDGFSYGVLSVYADRPRAFDETTWAVLGQLGQTIAYAIDAAERKRALLTDDVVELEFEITDTNCLFFQLAQQLHCTLRLEGLHSRGQAVIAFVTVTHATPERFVAEATKLASVGDANVIRETDDGALVELYFVRPLLATTLLDRGVTLNYLRASPSETKVILDVPGTVDARSVVERVARSYPDSAFLARRERSQPIGGEHEVHDRVLERLTDRQHEVVQVAFLGGYFESPRTTTGEELAAALGISPTAFHGHLRAVQRKVFAALFEPIGGDQHRG